MSTKDSLRGPVPHPHAHGPKIVTLHGQLTTTPSGLAGVRLTSFRPKTPD